MKDLCHGCKRCSKRRSCIKAKVINFFMNTIGEKLFNRVEIGKCYKRGDA